MIAYSNNNKIYRYVLLIILFLLTSFLHLWFSYVTFQTTTSVYIIHQSFVSFIAELICFFTARFLIYIGTHSKTAASNLAVVFYIIGLAFMSASASASGNTLARFIVSHSVMIIPIVFMHFMVVFLREKTVKQYSLKWIRYLYIVLVFIFFIRLLVFSLIDDPLFSFYDRTIILIWLTIGIIGNILYLLLVYYWEKHVNAYIASTIRIIWFALMLSFIPFIVLSAIPHVINGSTWVDYSYTSWCILLFPMSFIYLIFARQLFDVKLFFNRILFVFMISLAPTVIIYGLILLHGVVQGTFIRLFLMLISILGVIATMHVLYERYHFQLEKYLFPKRFKLLASHKKISLILSGVKTLIDIREKVLIEIVNTLEIKGAALILCSNDRKQIVMSYGSIDTSCFESNDTYIKNTHKSNFSGDDSYSVIPISTSEDYSSSIALSEKTSKTRMSREEFQWIQSIVLNISLVLENLYLVDKLTLKVEELLVRGSVRNTNHDSTWFRKAMFQMQENERERIASDLHDTVMQDIFFVRQRLGSLVEREKQGKIPRNELIEVIDHLEIINVTVRETCSNLFPYSMADIGFLNTVGNYIEQESKHDSIIIHFTKNNNDQIERLGDETKRHLFRIVQELISNMKKHSKATDVNIRFSLVDEMFYLQYEDDGVGFNENDFNMNDNRDSRMGLIQIKNRVQSLNGEIKLMTEPYKGVKAEIMIPVEGTG